MVSPAGAALVAGTVTMAALLIAAGHAILICLILPPLLDRIFRYPWWDDDEP